jgi:hypothetical protein
MQQGNKQTAVSEQRLGKQFPSEKNTHTTIEDCVFDVVRVRLKELGQLKNPMISSGIALSYYYYYYYYYWSHFS